MTPSQTEQLRQQAIVVLADQGVHMAQAAPIEAVVAQITKITGKGRTQRQKKTDYVKCWLDALKGPVNPAYQRTFSNMKTPHKDMAGANHFRFADIQRSQPPMVVPTGTGNYNQYTTYMLGNGRSR